MTKKNFIALAKLIKEHNQKAPSNGVQPFTQTQIDSLSNFCQSQNSAFKRGRWVAYILGECGPCGGAVKK